jgi:hypothetical protein
MFFGPSFFILFLYYPLTIKLRWIAKAIHLSFDGRGGFVVKPPYGSFTVFVAFVD